MTAFGQAEEPGMGNVPTSVESYQISGFHGKAVPLFQTIGVNERLL